MIKFIIISLKYALMILVVHSCSIFSIEWENLLYLLREQNSLRGVRFQLFNGTDMGGQKNL